MVESLRIPLSVPTVPRNTSLIKDALLKNCYIDQGKQGNKFAVKRPGFYVGTEAITTGLNRGIYYDPYTGFTWYLNNLGILTRIYYQWQSFLHYITGDMVEYNGINYIATADNFDDIPSLGLSWIEEEVLVLSGDFLIPPNDVGGGVTYIFWYRTDNSIAVSMEINYTDINYPTVVYHADCGVAGVTIYEIEATSYTGYDTPTFLSIAENYRLTKDSNNFYLYHNDGLVVTSPYIVTSYSYAHTIGVTNPILGNPEA